MKRIIYFLAIFLFFISSFSKITFASIEDGNCSTQEECENIKNQLTQKLGELSKTRDTLSNQIKILDSQAQLTAVKIIQTENSIKLLEKEISSLTVKINELDIDLNQLSSIFIKQIVQNYKLQKKIPYFSILNFQNFNSFLEQFKYISVVQNNSQNTLLNMETVRTTYDMQKAEKEKKQKELEVLQKQLDQQKISLANQKTSKSRLLTVTKNDEDRYKQLLAQAQAQLNSFGNFVNISGGSSLLSNQTHCDSWGCYYNQRDSEWGNITFGYSENKNGTRTYYDMKGYGCLITSTTMILNHYGKSVKPSDLARDSNLFFSHSGDMNGGELFTNGIKFNRTIGFGYSLSSADSELNENRPVIAGVSCNKGIPSHFIVIKSKKDGKYIINDPYPENGYEKPLNYNVCRIDSIRVY